MFHFEMRPKILSLVFSLSRFFALIFIATFNISSAESASKPAETTPPSGTTPSPTVSTSTDVFAFHLPVEPASLNPARLSSTDASYLFINLYRGLYGFRTGEGLRPEGAKSCRFTQPLLLTCELDPRRRWSDGSTIVAADYVRAFRNLVGPDAKNPGVEILQNVKNATETHAGKAKPDALGIRAIGDFKIEIEFQRPDPDFIYKLTSPLLVPVKSSDFPDRANASKLVVNGPYQIASWESGRRLRLKPNPSYSRGNPLRPNVDAYFIDDDDTALSLYEQGRLTLLRRLPTTYIATHRMRPDFVQVPVSRFDYIGFGPDLMNGSADLRRALSLSLDFEELRRIFHALGIPGCPSLPEIYMDKTPCLRFDPKAAREAWARIPTAQRPQRLTLAFSKLGGDDPKRAAEWVQAQWRKHLGLRVNLEQTEQGVFLQKLRTAPPSIFRKGVGLDRPTCLAALETFAPGGAENFLRLDIPEYNRVLENLSRASTDPEKKRLCGDGVRLLVNRHLLIPLGRMHFTLLVRPRFQGWHLNELNQLDLSDLRVTSP